MMPTNSTCAMSADSVEWPFPTSPQLDRFCRPRPHDPQQTQHLFIALSAGDISLHLPEIVGRCSTFGPIQLLSYAARRIFCCVSFDTVANATACQAALHNTDFLGVGSPQRLAFMMLKRVCRAAPAALVQRFPQCSFAKCVSGRTQKRPRAQPLRCRCRMRRSRSCHPLWTPRCSRMK